MFEILEEFWESLDKIREILAIHKEKVCNFISDLIKEQRKAIFSEIQKVLDKYLKVISKED